MNPADWDYPEHGAVRAVMVSTVDGAATLASGTTGTLGGEVDKEFFSLQRSLADVIVVGAGTARAEGYRPVQPHEVDADLRKSLGLAPVPTIAVATRSGDVPDELEGQIVLTAPINWTAVLADFHDRGWHRISVEGGPHLLAELAELNLVDEVCLTVAPVLASGDAPRITNGPRPIDRPLTLLRCEAVGDVVLTRWARVT